MATFLWSRSPTHFGDSIYWGRITRWAFVESLKRVRHFSHFGRHSHISCFIFKSLRERSPVWKLEAESVDEFSCLFWIWLLQKVGDGNPLVCFMLGFTINPPVCTNRWRHTRHIGCNTRFLLEVLHLKRRLAARFGTLCRPYPKQRPSLASQEYLTSRLIIQHGNCHFSDRFCGKCQVRTMLPWCDSIRIQVSYALAAPHLHVRLAKLRCDGNGGDYIGWQEGIEEE